MLKYIELLDILNCFRLLKNTFSINQYCVINICRAQTFNLRGQRSLFGEKKNELIYLTGDAK